MTSDWKIAGSVPAFPLMCLNPHIVFLVGTNGVNEMVTVKDFGPTKKVVKDYIGMSTGNMRTSSGFVFSLKKIESKIWEKIRKKF